MRDHFGQCAVEELLWATQGSLWPVCCGSAALPTILACVLAHVLLKFSRVLLTKRILTFVVR